MLGEFTGHLSKPFPIARMRNGIEHVFALLEEMSEPIGGAHRDARLVIDRVGESIKSALGKMRTICVWEEHRNQKFLDFGRVAA